ncbi:DUF2637 domain-containing protein [Nocardia sp. NPDC055321]
MTGNHPGTTAGHSGDAVPSGTPELPDPTTSRAPQGDTCLSTPPEVIAEETPAPPPCDTAAIEETAVETRAQWDRVEGAALAAVTVVLVVAGGWSAIALHDLAQQAGMTSWLAWGAPFIVDGPIFQSAIALVVLKRREKAGVHVSPGKRRYFMWTLALAELISLIGNGAHAAEVTVSAPIAAIIASTAPIAALAVLHGLTILIEIPRAPDDSPRKPDNIEHGLDRTSTEVPIPLSPMVSPGDTRVSPAVSFMRTGDTDETSAVSPLSPRDTEGDSDETDEVLDTAERDERILAMSDRGMTLRQIAPMVGLSHGQVGKILARLRAEDDHARGPDPDDDSDGNVLHLIR